MSLVKPDPLILANRLGKTSGISGFKTGKNTRMVTLVIDNGSNTSERPEIITPTETNGLSSKLRNKTSLGQSKSQNILGVRVKKNVASTTLASQVDRRAISPSKSKSLLM